MADRRSLTRGRAIAGRWRSLAGVYLARGRTSAQLSRAVPVQPGRRSRPDHRGTDRVPRGVAARRRREWRRGRWFTSGRFAAYYITFGFVRICMQSGSPSNWQRAVQRGDLSGQLLLPIHPVHVDLAMWLGFCVTRAVMWIPIGAVLVVAYRPDFDTSVWQVAAFMISLVPALAMRTLINDITGMASFWFVSIVAIDGVMRIFENLLSGRLVPPDLLPGWAQTLSKVLPFEWGFAFPIKALIGPMSTDALLRGLGMQMLWVIALWMLMRLVWNKGVRRYGAVSG